MNISELTPQEKSVMLATAAGWIQQKGIAYGFKPTAELSPLYDHLATFLNHKPEHVCPDIYDPDNMCLAWGILRWSREQRAMVKDWIPSEPPESYDYPMGNAMYEWFFEMVDVTKMPPAAAQAAWLDKILSLAIEAGLVEAHS